MMMIVIHFPPTYSIVTKFTGSDFDFNLRTKSWGRRVEYLGFDELISIVSKRTLLRRRLSSVIIYNAIIFYSAYDI